MQGEVCLFVYEWFLAISVFVSWNNYYHSSSDRRLWTYSRLKCVYADLFLMCDCTVISALACSSSCRVGLRVESFWVSITVVYFSTKNKEFNTFPPHKFVFHREQELCTSLALSLSPQWHLFLVHAHVHTLTHALGCHIEHARVCPLTDRKAAGPAEPLWWGELWTLAASGSVCSSPCEGNPAAASSSPPQTLHPAETQREKQSNLVADKRFKKAFKV